MNAFYRNGSYGNEPIVERRTLENQARIKRKRLGYNSLKIISFFPSNSYLCFGIYFKEIKLFSVVFIEHGDLFTFHNPLGAYLERRYFVEFDSISCAIPRVDDYDFNIVNCVNCVLGLEDRRSMEEELGPILEESSISLSPNPSSLCYEEFSPTCLHHNINERKEMYHGVRRLRQKWRKTNLMLWRFDNEFFFKPFSLLPCVFLQRVKIVLIIELVLDVDHMLKYSSPCAFLEKELVVFKAHVSDLVKTTFGSGVFELNLKNLAEKHLGYSIAFLEDLYYIRNSYRVATLIGKLNDLLAYSLLSLECLGNFHSILPFNASISNVATSCGYLKEWIRGRILSRKGGWYDPGCARNRRAIARSHHKSHG
ncbi:hypothetical protein M9H77_17560 [Catharanthus roseus]|uniref:Uncharacterized protein n=1 Tax=Catharanthus roseus TaxID=4058 RepID=A0ACC0B502_CATRO|nr:hypothetical protein M9H77_17560 [Catharanthus roseus]